MSISKKRPNMIHIDNESHKILRRISARLNKPMGEIAECLIREKYQKILNNRKKHIDEIKTYEHHKYTMLLRHQKNNIGGGVIQNDEK